MQIIIYKQNTLLCDEFKFKCSVGKNGVSSNKKEGDLKTPKGTYALGPLFYRIDRIPKIITKLKKIPIKKNMGWCNDTNNKSYNKLINTKFKVRHEKMFRNDEKYDLVICINYNTKKIIKNKGSAIFLHLTKDYKKTQGCIAMKKKDFLILLKVIKKRTKIKIL